MTRAVAAVLLLLLTAPAIAQRPRRRGDAEVVTRPVPPVMALTILARREGVPIDAATLPAEARRYWARVQNVHRYLREAILRRNAAARAARDEGARRAILRRSDEEIGPLQRQLDQTLPRLLTALEAERRRDRLDAHGWLALGEARWQLAGTSHLRALDAYERTLETCGERCPDPPAPEYGPAAEAFRESATRACAAGAPAGPCGRLGAWARYGEALGWGEVGRTDEMIAALEAGVAAAGPPALIAEMRHRLGDVAFDERRWEDAARSYDAAVGDADGAIRRYTLHRRAWSRHMAGQWLESVDAAVVLLRELRLDEAFVADAREIAAWGLDAQSDFTGGTLPPDTPPEIAAPILATLAVRLHRGGHRAEAERALAAATARGAHPAIAEARAAIAATPIAAGENGLYWATRLVRRCAAIAGRVPEVQGEVELRLSLDRRGIARARARARLTDVVAQARVSQCFALPQPVPLEPRVRNARARIVVRME